MQGILNKKKKFFHWFLSLNLGGRIHACIRLLHFVYWKGCPPNRKSVFSIPPHYGRPTLYGLQIVPRWTLKTVTRGKLKTVLRGTPVIRTFFFRHSSCFFYNFYFTFCVFYILRVLSILHMLCILGIMYVVK